MKETKGLGAVSILLLCGAVFAQQPNSGSASMTINGTAGPPYPIFTNVPTSTLAVFTLSGGGNRPYVIYQSPALTVGSAFIPANNSLNSVDLALNPFPTLVIDGAANPALFSTNATGVGGFAIPVPQAGTPGVPIGLSLALQGAVADAFSSIGLTLTAATQITVTQGPTSGPLSLAGNGQFIVNTSASPIPYYGTSYSLLTIYENGYIIMGAAPPSDFVPSATLFVSGFPRVAGFWMDLDQGAGTITLTTATPTGGAPGYVRVDYTNVQEFLIPFTSHTFSMVLRTDGTLEIIHPPTQNAPAGYDVITGIGPGGNLGLPQPQQNFVGPDPDGAGSQTTGILTTPPFSKFGAPNEAFYEWFGDYTMPNYPNAYLNPFDLFAWTLHFLPNGPGALPQSTIGYTLY